MIPSFVTAYKHDDQIRVYFYPGLDDMNRAISKIEFVQLTDDFNYKYVKNVDKSIEYVITTSADKIVIDVIDIISKNRVRKEYVIAQLRQN